MSSRLNGPLTYPGGKNAAGTFQKIINQQPPHRVYIEPFLGSGAVLRRKKSAEVNYGIDIDPEAVGKFDLGEIKEPATLVQSFAAGRHTYEDLVGRAADWRSTDGQTTDWRRPIEAMMPSPSWVVICTCGIRFLEEYPWQGDELVYCDPPYLLDNRRQYYRHNLVESDHERLLRILFELPCKVQISGYWSRLYADRLAGWRSIHWQAMTRGGARTEWLWMNYPEPTQLHDYSYVGENKRTRQDFRRMRARWINRLKSLPVTKRYALLAALEEIRES